MKVQYCLTILLLAVLIITINPEMISMAQEDTTAADVIEEDRSFDPPLIGYQGRLLENGNPVSGNRTMTFELFQSQNDGTAIWVETKLITVNNGLFHTNLGDTTPFPFATINEMDQNLWLEVTVGSDTLPRQLLTGSPYAFSLVPGARIAGDTTDFVLQALNENNTGLFGGSRFGTGVFGESFGMGSIGAGVHGVSDAGSGVLAGSYSVGENPAPALQAQAFGTGPILGGMGGTDQDLDFVVENDGSVKQSLDANGLVKVGLLFECGQADEYGNGGVTLIRSFNNVGGEINLSADIDNPGSCVISFDFDISDRYWLAQGPTTTSSPDPTIVSCERISDTELWCTRWDLFGVAVSGGPAVVSGEIMLIIY